MEVSPQLLAKKASGKWKKCMEAGGGWAEGGPERGQSRRSVPALCYHPWTAFAEAVSCKRLN